MLRKEYLINCFAHCSTPIAAPSNDNCHGSRMCNSRKRHLQLSLPGRRKQCTLTPHGVAGSSNRAKRQPLISPTKHLHYHYGIATAGVAGNAARRPFCNAPSWPTRMIGYMVRWQGGGEVCIHGGGDRGGEEGGRRLGASGRRRERLELKKKRGSL